MKTPFPLILTIAARYLTHASTCVCEPGGVDETACRQVADWLRERAEARLAVQRMHARGDAIGGDAQP